MVRVRARGAWMFGINGWFKDGGGGGLLVVVVVVGIDVDGIGGIGGGGGL